LENVDIRDTLIEKSRYINDNVPFRISDKIADILVGYRKPKVTIFGVSYKENIGDIRESPALVIYNELTKRGINVSAYDPLVSQFVHLLSGLEDSLKDSDLLLMFVGHEKFKEISLERISSLMRNKNIFDTRNFFDKKVVEKYGFKYYFI